jgi:DNA-binding winged helix-turn-helix (wHTH) protein
LPFSAAAKERQAVRKIRKLPASFAFDQFVLDTADRRLRTRSGPVELNGRYFDALALLVGEEGKLVSKDRFLAEVWRGVPVTDEALTQCIRTLRRQLGDDASNPRFIETVPKHGYRFIAPVQLVDGHSNVAAQRAGDAERWREFVRIGAAGTLGGAIAGAIGGLLYGFLGASQPSQAGVGALSTVLVVLCVTVVVGVIGAAGVSFAIATAVLTRPRSREWLILAGAGGGLVVGATVKLLGLDAFTLLVGRAPAAITGAMEGLLLGTAVGLSAWFAFPRQSLRKAAAFAAPMGALAGLAATMLGGRFLLGSLALLEREFPASRLRIDQLGRLFGESGFGPITQLITSALEGALFSSVVVVAMTYVQRKLSGRR